MKGEPKFFVLRHPLDGKKHSFLERVALDARTVIVVYEGRQLEVGVNTNFGNAFYVNGSEMTITPHASNAILIRTGDIFTWSMDDAVTPDVEKLRVRVAELEDAIQYLQSARSRAETLRRVASILERI